MVVTGDLPVTTRRVMRTVAQWLEIVFTPLPLGHPGCPVPPPGSPCRDSEGCRLLYSSVILAVSRLSRLC